MRMLERMKYYAYSRTRDGELAAPGCRVVTISKILSKRAVVARRLDYQPIYYELIFGIKLVPVLIMRAPHLPDSISHLLSILWPHFLAWSACTEAA